MKTGSSACTLEERQARLAQEPPRIAAAPELHGLQSSDEQTARLGDRLLSGRAVRAMTGNSSRRKIRHWVERGEFNCYALDGKPVYSEQEVLDFRERVKAQGPSRAPWRGNESTTSLNARRTL
jgi:hypothetical protein